MQSVTPELAGSTPHSSKKQRFFSRPHVKIVGSLDDREERPQHEIAWTRNSNPVSGGGGFLIYSTSSLDTPGRSVCEIICTCTLTAVVLTPHEFSVPTFFGVSKHNYLKFQVFISN